MVYNFKFKLNKKDLFLSSIYYTYFSIGGIFSILFTIFSIGILIYTFINNSFFNMSIQNRILLIFCCMVFSVIQPIMIYIKVIKRFRKYKQNEVNLEFYVDNFKITIGNESGEFNYNMIYKIKKYYSMVVLMYNAINGQIIPDRAFNNNKNEFYNFILEKIKK